MRFIYSLDDCLKATSAKKNICDDDSDVLYIRKPM